MDIRIGVDLVWQRTFRGTYDATRDGRSSHGRYDRQERTSLLQRSLLGPIYRVASAKLQGFTENDLLMKIIGAHNVQVQQDCWWSINFLLLLQPRALEKAAIAMNPCPDLSPKGFTWRQIRAGIHWRLNSYTSHTVRVHTPPWVCPRAVCKGRRRRWRRPRVVECFAIGWNKIW